MVLVVVAYVGFDGVYCACFVFVLGCFTFTGLVSWVCCYLLIVLIIYF